MGEKEADGDGELIALVGGPAVDVLKKTGEGLLLERFLKIFVSMTGEEWVPLGMGYGCTF